MRFFTRAFHRGDLSDRDADDVVAAYERHLDALAPALPATVRVLARELVLHGARIRRVVLDRRGRELRLELRCGDERVGHYDLDLTYLGAIVDAADVATLAAAARAVEAQVLFDEVDLALPGDSARGTAGGTAGGTAFLHRLLFWPYREAEVMFRALALRMLPRGDASVPEFADRFVEVSG